MADDRPENDGETSDQDQEDDTTPLKQSRHVVDFDMDDNEWEDVDDTQLQGVGKTTHLTKRDWEETGGPGGESGQMGGGMQGQRNPLSYARVDTVQGETESQFVQRQNLERMNAGRGLGDHYTMLEVKRMVADDPFLLEGFTDEETKEMIVAVMMKRKPRRTMERLMDEMTCLAERVGRIGFAIFLSGHVHDKTLPVLKNEPANVAYLFELWAGKQGRISCCRCSRKRRLSSQWGSNFLARTLTAYSVLVRLL
ncbi:hypothetical protein C8R45DRAFT_942695 [Mycena sanguinolenta]|nr:hypothetical protein C8R45DRAFT_942695 [Mycena sanguinolenta]